MSYYPPPAPGGPGAYGVPPAPPANHLVWAILTTLFCCLPAGVVSIVFAAQVNGKWNSGDHAGAIAASKNAKTWAIVSAIVGVVVGVLYFIFTVALASNSSTY
ncbi:CD225/dispanin family protein [Actinomadura sp. LOL_016]|uniref:CD225/dispanin family protein n=1 Tax=unclassified Actinomadura TaxID=2626254 RepID=UPI003A807A6E